MLGFNEVVKSRCTKKNESPKLTNRPTFLTCFLTVEGDLVFHVLFVFFEILPPGGNKEELFSLEQEIL